MSPGPPLALRARQATLLLPTLARTITWTPMLVTAALGLVNLVRLRWGNVLVLDGAVFGVRLAAVSLCLGAVFGLDDRARETVGPTPATLAFRRGLRLAFLVGLAGMLWAGLMWFAARIPLAPGHGGGSLPAGGLTLELGALLAVTWAAAGLRRSRPRMARAGWSRHRCSWRSSPWPWRWGGGCPCSPP